MLTSLEGCHPLLNISEGGRRDTPSELPGLSPVSGNRAVARFDGSEMSSDGGLPLLREVEERIGLADRLAGCLVDTRDPERLDHKMAAILRFRMLMIAAGYEDGNDATSLRHDPVFKMATERLLSEPDLCSQPTISRMENTPDVRALLRMAGALVEQYTGFFTKVPKRIVLDVDDTFDAVHGHQQLRLFNAHYDDYGFQPILVFDDAARLVAAMIRPAKRPNGRQVRAFLRRLIRRIRSIWPRVEILVRGDRSYAGDGRRGDVTPHSVDTAESEEVTECRPCRPRRPPPAKLPQFTPRWN